jgi:hypothetical protein
LWFSHKNQPKHFERNKCCHTITNTYHPYGHHTKTNHNIAKEIGVVTQEPTPTNPEVSTQEPASEIFIVSTQESTLKK